MKNKPMNKVIMQAHDLFKTAGFDYAICGGFGEAGPIWQYLFYKIEDIADSF